MTLNQLKVFVLVVRLGSFRAAAHALGVSEPAVAQAVTALRQSLGDPLLSRGAAGIDLTPAGQRIVGLASQMVNLAVEAEAAVRQARGGPELLRLVATATPGDAVAPALLQAFLLRTAHVEATLGIATTEEMGALLSERLGDVAIGPRLAGSLSPGIISEPMMRYRMVIVAATRHPLALVPGPVRQRRLVDQRWFVDPGGTDPLSDVGLLLARLGVPDERVTVFPSQRLAWAAAATTGEGIAPAVEHLLAREQLPLAVLPIEGMPLDLLWHVNTLAPDRRPPAVARLLRFLATPDSTQVMFKADGRVPASKFRPPVHVTIWS
jgi:DNA-binding transcriptional LysR family regulator